jgi:predicted secreted protein
VQAVRGKKEIRKKAIKNEKKIVRVQTVREIFHLRGKSDKTAIFRALRVRSQPKRAKNHIPTLNTWQDAFSTFNDAFPHTLFLKLKLRWQIASNV